MEPALATALDHGLPYTGLRGFDVDPRLWAYVPPAYAVEERVLPVALVGDELTVAASRPDPDLAPIAAHLPNLRLGVVLAPTSEIDAVLARVTGPDA